jgi:glutathione S-transferase
MAESNKLTLGYWAFRGRAQVTRFLIEYLGLSYTDKQYTSPQEWGKDKSTLGFDFPNLPYIIDGDFKLTETSALIKYIPLKAKKPELNGKNEYDEIQVQSILGVILDVAKVLGDIAFGPKDGWDKFKSEKVASLSPKLGLLSKYLGKKDWLLGYITISDFQFAYILDILLAMEKNALKDMKNLADLHARFFNLDSIKKYVASDKYPPYYFPPSATWTG